MSKIALCGFMGCGKSTVACALSEKYNLDTIDTDKYIEEKLNCTISDIFKNNGEDYFRDCEYNAIAELSQQNDCVLSLGGGAVIFQRNAAILRQHGYKIVFINTDFDVIKKRLFSDNTRPLLKTNDIATLFKSRLPVYKEVCDIEIECSDETAQDIADMIIDKL